MKTKPGVDLRWLSPPAWWGAHVADQLHQEMTGAQVTITSTAEGKHTAHRSDHYAGGYMGLGRAFDLRTWYVPESKLAEFVDRLHQLLGDDYKVIREPTHIHVAWSPVFRPLRGPLADDDTDTA